MAVSLRLEREDWSFWYEMRFWFEMSVARRYLLKRLARLPPLLLDLPMPEETSSIGVFTLVLVPCGIFELPPVEVKD